MMKLIKKKQQQQSEFNTREWLLVRFRKSEKGTKEKKRKRNETGISLKKKLFDIREMYFYDICKTETERKNKKNNHTILCPSPGPGPEIKTPS